MQGTIISFGYSVTYYAPRSIVESDLRFLKSLVKVDKKSYNDKFYTPVEDREEIVVTLNAEINQSILNVSEPKEEDVIDSEDGGDF